MISKSILLATKYSVKNLKNVVKKMATKMLTWCVICEFGIAIRLIKGVFYINRGVLQNYKWSCLTLRLWQACWRGSTDISRTVPLAPDIRARCEEICRKVSKVSTFRSSKRRHVRQIRRKDVRNVRRSFPWWEVPSRLREWQTNVRQSSSFVTRWDRGNVRQGKTGSDRPSRPVRRWPRHLENSNNKSSCKLLQLR